jgi:hypothetical protein
MDEPLLASLIDKVDAQDRKIEDLNKKVDQPPAYQDIFNFIEMRFEGLQRDVREISFPKKDMLELSGSLATCIELFKRPVEQKIIQRHHVPNIIWITAALFVLLSLATTGWFTTYNNLELYKGSDTKYRYLKLKSDKGLNMLLNFIDSVYVANPNMREFVIAKEEQKQRDFEINQRVLQMENEVRELKRKVHKKRR